MRRATYAFDYNLLEEEEENEKKNCSVPSKCTFELSGNYFI